MIQKVDNVYFELDGTSDLMLLVIEEITDIEGYMTHRNVARGSIYLKNWSFWNMLHDLLDTLIANDESYMRFRSVLAELKKIIPIEKEESQ